MKYAFLIVGCLLTFVASAQKGSPSVNFYFTLEGYSLLDTLAGKGPEPGEKPNDELSLDDEVVQGPELGARYSYELYFQDKMVRSDSGHLRVSKANPDVCHCAYFEADVYHPAQKNFPVVNFDRIVFHLIHGDQSSQVEVVLQKQGPVSYYLGELSLGKDLTFDGVNYNYHDRLGRYVVKAIQTSQPESCFEALAAYQSRMRAEREKAARKNRFSFSYSERSEKKEKRVQPGKDRDKQNPVVAVPFQERGKQFIRPITVVYPKGKKGQNATVEVNGKRYWQDQSTVGDQIQTSVYWTRRSRSNDKKSNDTVVIRHPHYPDQTVILKDRKRIICFYDKKDRLIYDWGVLRPIDYDINTNHSSEYNQNYISVKIKVPGPRDSNGNLEPAVEVDSATLRGLRVASVPKVIETKTPGDKRKEFQEDNKPEEPDGLIEKEKVPVSVIRGQRFPLQYSPQELDSLTQLAELRMDSICREFQLKRVVPDPDKRLYWHTYQTSQAKNFIFILKRKGNKKIPTEPSAWLQELRNRPGIEFVGLPSSKRVEENHYTNAFTVYFRPDVPQPKIDSILASVPVVKLVVPDPYEAQKRMRYQRHRNADPIAVHCQTDPALLLPPIEVLQKLMGLEEVVRVHNTFYQFRPYNPSMMRG